MVPSVLLLCGFASGSYVVGNGAGQVPPGTYTASGGARCKWTISGAGGRVLVAGGSRTAQRVTLLRADRAFTSSGCGEWKVLDTSITADAPTPGIPTTTKRESAVDYVIRVRGRFDVLRQTFRQPQGATTVRSDAEGWTRASCTALLNNWGPYAELVSTPDPQLSALGGAMQAAIFAFLNPCTIQVETSRDGSRRPAVPLYAEYQGAVSAVDRYLKRFDDIDPRYDYPT